MSLVKENFNKSSVLGKELSCYKLLDENLGVDKYTAEKIIFRTKKEYDSLDKDHMLKIQKLMAKEYALKAKVNDATGGMAALLEKVGTKKSAEND